MTVLARYKLFLFLLCIGIPKILFAADEVGSTSGSFNVGSSGAANYAIPIAVLPGTGGMKPDISLVYNNMTPNGHVGIGWSLSGFSAITRCPATIAQDGFRGEINFDSNDRFCLDGQRLIEKGGYGLGIEYRTETDSMSRIVAYGTQGSGPQYFLVWTKAGIKLEYGVTDASRIEVNGSHYPSVRVWAVNRVEDTLGNYFTIAYSHLFDQGEYYPYRIDYTGNTIAGLTPTKHVTFEFETRPYNDQITTYLADSKVSTTKRLKRIFTENGNVIVRTYNLTYEQGAITKRSRLTSIQECGATGLCNPPTTFTWQETNNNFTLILDSMQFEDFPIGNIRNSPALNTDINNDGKTDLLFYSLDYGQFYPFLSNGNGTFSRGTTLSHSNRIDYFTFGDFRGNGRTDIMAISIIPPVQRFDSPITQLKTYLSNGDGTFTLADTTNSVYDTFKAIGSADFNGDGKTDIFLDNTKERLTSIRQENVSESIYPLISDGNGHFSNNAGGHLNFGTGRGGTTAFTGDVNGDGKSDVVTAKDSVAKIYISEGDGTFTLVSQTLSILGNEIYLIDVNGDFRTDILNRSGANFKAYISLGNGLFTTSYSTDSFTYPSYAWALSASDINVDGRLDLVFKGLDGSGERIDVLLSNSDGRFDPGPSLTVSGTLGWQFFPADINGDARIDYVIQSGQSVKVYNGDQTYPDMISGITDGFGARNTITYKPITDSTVYTRGSGSTYPEIDIQTPMYVVAQSSRNDGIGGQYSVSYTYGGAKAHLEGRGFLGFRWREVLDLETNLNTRIEYMQLFPKIGMVESSKQTTSTAVIINQVSNVWGANSTIASGGTYYALHLDNSTETKRELDGNAINSTTTSYQYDVYGNATNITANISRTISGVTTTYSTTTASTYTNDTNNWILGRLTRTEVTKTSSEITGSAKRISSFEYYTGSGLLKSETIEPDSTTLWLKTSYVYDSYGNITSSTITGPDIVSRAATTEYSSDGAYPAAVFNPLGHKESYEYDERFGAVKKITGPNNLVTTWVYDELGRKKTEARADGTTTTWDYQWCTSCPLPQSARTPKYFITTQVTGAAPVTAYYDELGRAVFAETTGFSATGTGTKIYTDTQYNSRALVERTSKPYYAGTATANIHWSTATYDILGRVRTGTAPDGTVSEIEYTSRSIVTHADRNGKNQITTKWINVIGQTTKVDQPEGSVAQYEYDHFGNTTRFYVQGSNPSTMQYDIRGRKTAMDDTDMGHWEYQYNTLGELIWQKDANGQITTMEYDKLGRLMSRTEPNHIGQGTVTSTWEYDTATKGVGKLAKVIAPNTKRVHTYDAYGRPESETTTILSQDYRVSWTYDSAGRVEKTTYPSTNFAVKNIYTTHGYLKEVRNATSSALYWKADTINSEMQVVQETLGNNVSTTYGYKRSTGRLETINAGNGSIQNLRFSYDRLGNLEQRSDDRQVISEGFTYDGLNRIKTNTIGTSTVTYEYYSNGNIKYKPGVGYYHYQTQKAHAVTDVTVTSTINGTAGILPGDANGDGLFNETDIITVSDNIMQNVSPANSDCNQDSTVDIRDIVCIPYKQDTNRIGHYTYDANGNMLTGPGVNVSYTAFNMPYSISRGNASTSFTYDPEHSRIIQQGSEGTTIYINPRADSGAHYEKEIKGVIVEHKYYIYGGTGMVAVHIEQNPGSANTRYFHKDHLGSIDTITDETGAVVERLSFDAFGQRRLSNWQKTYGDIDSKTTHHGFTGHEHLDGVGLIHMNGRVYDPILGRFLSADPFIQAPFHSQSINRYSYVWNNPLSVTDPSGYFSLGDLGDFIGDLIKPIARPIQDGLEWVNRNVPIETLIAITLAIVVQNPYYAGFLSGFTGSGGDFRSGLIGAFTAGMFNFAGGLGQAGTLGRTGMVIAHGAIGGISAELNGGDFIHGFLSGAATKGFAPAIDSIIDPSSAVQNAIAGAIVGGTASALGGGKFANGAVTGAFSRLFGQLSAKTEEGELLEGIKVYRKDIDVNGDDKYGHWWIEIDGSESYGWWPKEPVGLVDTIIGVDGELNGQSYFGGTATLDPHHGDRSSGVKVFDVYGAVPRDTAINIIRNFASTYNGNWSWPIGQNCHSFQEKLLRDSGLTIRRSP